MCAQLPVRALAFSPAGDYALSASSGERQIALWRLAVGSTKKRQASAGLLSLEEPAVRIATAPPASGSAPEGAFQASHTAISRVFVFERLPSASTPAAGSVCTPVSLQGLLMSEEVESSGAVFHALYILGCRSQQ